MSFGIYSANEEEICLQTSTKKEIFSWITTIAVVAIIIFLTRTFLFTPVSVNGKSMEPTFEHSDKLIISKISDIENFDMIVFDAPNKDEEYIKRVIGKPGDSIKMEDGVLYINDKSYEEPYIKENHDGFDDFTLKELTGKEKVPDNQLFVLGDNRSNSKDSRAFGFISADSVVGEVKFQFYPWQEIGIPD